MITLTLARKPCSEGSLTINLLKHGVGGLNIDQCRLATIEHLHGGSGGLLSDVREFRSWGYYAGEEDNGYNPNPLGRWPRI